MQGQPKLYKPADKLRGKIAIVTGGESGLGRAVSRYFAREGADVVLVYETQDEAVAETVFDTKDVMAAIGRRSVLMKGDVSDVAFCRAVADKTIATFGAID